VTEAELLRLVRALSPANRRRFLLVGKAVAHADDLPPQDAARARAILAGLAAGTMDSDLAAAFLTDLGFPARGDA
jgi:hypothetical protein